MPHDPKRIEVLITAALGKATPEELAAYLEGACAGDEELRAQIQALLTERECANTLRQSQDAAEPAPSPNVTENAEGLHEAGAAKDPATPSPGQLGWALRDHAA